MSNRSRWGQAVTAVVARLVAMPAIALASWSAPAHGADAAEAARPLRVAVAQIGELQVAKTLGELGPDVVVKAAAQGVRDACLDTAAGRFREPVVCEHPAVSVPAGVCADMTLERAQAAFVPCASGDRSAEVVELGSSPCRTTECLRVDAKALGATHVLVVQGRTTDFGLDVAADLLDLSSGAAHAKRYRDYFPAKSREDANIIPRTGPQVLGIIHGMARDVIQVGLIEQLVPATTVTTPATPPAPPPPGLAPTWVGWTLIGAGAAAVAAGGALWLLDGNSKDCAETSEPRVCPYQWDTKKIGIPMLIVGAMAATGGSIVLLRKPQGPELNLTAFPSGAVLLHGRF